jgi:hypothetical protein
MKRRAQLQDQRAAWRSYSREPTSAHPRHHNPRRRLAPSLEAGLAAIRSTAPRRIRPQVVAVYANVPATPMRRRFAAADPEMLDILVTMLRHYFRAVLEPYWPAVLRARRHDVDEAARRFLRSGVDGALAALQPGLRWRPPTLEIDTWGTRGVSGPG